MPTLAEALRAATRDLRAAGIPEPATDARLLVMAAAGIDRLALLRDPDAPLDAAAGMRLADALGRRRAREPVSRILGRREFWGLTLAVTPDVLDPRPDTETLVAAVLDGAAGGPSPRLLDLGTGSGAILCALLSEWPAARGVAVDRSEAACRVARRNLDACGAGERASVLCGDWGAALGGTFDVVVSNPPYVESADIPGLDPDVREHDPLAALDGGPDGLAAYRALAAALPSLLAPGGLAALEVGRGQDRAVAALLAAAGLGDVSVRPDLAGIGRAVTARRA